jgi:alanyl-tRNA synthetase
LFLKTLGKGMSLINNLIENACEKNLISGVEVFKLYDTYGFPPDLTSLILQENKLNYNKKAFDECMNNQKNQSKVASDMKIGDWIEVQDSESDGFIGYSQTSVNNVKLLKHRKIKIKNEYRFQLVFNKTPFYPEGGGQTADTGKIFVSNNINGDIFSFSVIDTKKENNLIVHTVLDHESRLEHYLGNFAYELTINKINRKLTSRNHSATHLLNHELRNLFGHHIEQKGSYVGPNYFRFDFSHFNKIEQKDLDLLEDRINNCIHQGVSLKESNNVPIEVARKNGALSLFGEKYDNTVRVIEFGDSIELCGGTHVSKTSEIGLFKIISESSIAAGIRRIEAVTSLSALNYVNKQLSTLNQIKVLLKNNDNILAQVSRLIKENKDLDKLSKDVKKNQADSLIKNLESKIKHINKVKFISTQLQVDPETMKNICFSLINKYDNIFIVLSTQKNNKVILNIALSKSLVNKRKINASKLINEVGVHVNARGGGQPFFAVASGDNLDGVDNIFQDLEKIIKDS